MLKSTCAVMPALTESDEVLWKNLREGSQQAFSLLFERYYGKLLNYGKSLMSSPEQVKDCVQDVFVDIWLYKSSLTEASSIKAYLMSSVRKRIARLHERERIFTQTTTLQEVEFLFDFTIEDQIIADEEMSLKVRQLNHLVNSLPSRQKEALFLRFHHGLDIEQVSEVMSINYQSVVNLLYKATQQLRSMWVGQFSLLLILFQFALK